MKIEMTERDKKLLIMLSVFVIVVCLGYWGVYPVVKDIYAIEDETEQQELIKSDYERKLVQIPMLEADNETWQKDIQSVRETFYPMMDSAGIDKYFTDMVLDYNLTSYDLSISIPDTEAELEPYLYSERARELEESVDTSEIKDSENGASGEQSEIEQAEQAGGLSDNTDNGSDPAVTEPVTTGIYEAGVTLRVGGDEDRLLELIEDLSNSDMKLRVCSYSWSEERSLTEVGEDGEYTIAIERVLTISLELYMYEEQLTREE